MQHLRCQICAHSENAIELVEVCQYLARPHLGLRQSMVDDVEESLLIHGIADLDGELCAAFCRCRFGKIDDSKIGIIDWQDQLDEPHAPSERSDEIFTDVARESEVLAGSEEREASDEERDEGKDG